MHTDGVVIANVAGELLTQCVLLTEDHAAGEFRLQGVEERFGMGVVARTEDARTLEEAKSSDLSAEPRAHVLRVAVAMKDHTGGRSSMGRPFESRAGHRGRAPSRERLRQDAA